MSNSPMHLSVSASTGQKIAVSVVGLLFLVVLGGIIGVAAATVGSSMDLSPDGFADSPFGATGDFPETAVTTLFAVIATLMVAFVAGMVLGTYRRRAILDGTMLQVRGTFTTRQADLATARVSIDSEPEYVRNPHGEGTMPTGRRVPHLVAEDTRSGQKVRLRLHSMARALLPSPELNALADAVESGVRDEPDSGQAATTAASLRRLADDPIARLL